jgi:RNA recognition motif-containing protein
MIVILETLIMTEIYVGNLSYDTVEQDLEDLFKKFGDVRGVKLIKDRDTGRSKGFAFVDFANSSQAQAAVKLDGEEFKGRRIKVNMAREKSSGSSGDQGRRRW